MAEIQTHPSFYGCPCYLQGLSKIDDRLSLLPVSMVKVHSKIKVLEWPQHFSHYKSMGIIPDAQGQLIP